MKKKWVQKDVYIRTALFVVCLLLALVPLFADPTTDTILKMVNVAGGSFKMGSAEDGSIHTVMVSSFKIARTELTNAQYMAVAGKNPSYFQDGADANNRPVEYISWYEAVAFCNLLSVKEGLIPAYTIAGTTVTLNPKATGYRLPTEAEWEYAARGGAKQDGTTYSGSNDTDTVAWFGDNSSYETHAVETKTANGLGLYDMSGNVWEWCWDLFAEYSVTAQTNPMGAASGSCRVVRGGSYDCGAANCDVANRGVSDPSGQGNQINGIGIRVVRP